MKSQVRGGTRWKRFAVVMVPSVAAAAAVGIGLAQGALAASFAISGQEFKVKADSLVGDDFVQYGSYAEGKNLKGEDFAAPVAVSGFTHATISNMCQSVVTPNVPLVGTITLRLTAGTGRDKVVADDIYLDVSDLKADAKFDNIDIGVAAGKTKKPGIQPGTKANPFGFAQQAKKATLSNVEQKAWATTAASFKLPDLSLKLLRGSGEGKECFVD
ncbi:DUF6230 family protein [Streptomyces sp. NPDC046887]|uniref:DUF6230 family protein n=1 Tax=Streptomyces sp. NPDC046887 TaxID=3155472 RepID=UPI00340372C1